MFGGEERRRPDLFDRIAVPRGFSTITRPGGVGITPAGEEVDVTESEVPEFTGTW
jgi:hypothetical protein